MSKAGDRSRRLGTVGSEHWLGIVGYIFDSPRQLFQLSTQPYRQTDTNF